MKSGKTSIFVCLVSAVIGCSSCSDNGILFRSVGSYDKATTDRSFYLIGKPYEVDGVTYTPAENYDYFDSGDAFWFTVDPDHPFTANGERNDGTRFTAMHRTLPLPSVVRITNLNNHASVLVRVNDRGPYDNARLIDVSEPVAKYLNFSKTTVTPVQVELMVAESKALKEKMQQKGADNRIQTVYSDSRDITNSDKDNLDKVDNRYSLNVDNTIMSETDQNQTKASSFSQSGGERVINADEILYPGMSSQDIQNLKIPQQSSSKSSNFGNKKNDTFATAVKAGSSRNTIYHQSNLHSGATSYYIQIGAFLKQSSVDNIFKRLSNYNNLFVKDKIKNNQTLHYVRVGPYSSYAMAEKVLDKIHASGYVESKIIQE